MRTLAAISLSLLAFPALAFDLTVGQRLDDGHLVIESGLRTDDDIPTPPAQQFQRMKPMALAAAAAKLGDAVSVVLDGGKVIPGTIEAVRLAPNEFAEAYALQLVVKTAKPLPKGPRYAFALVAPGAAKAGPAPAAKVVHAAGKAARVEAGKLSAALDVAAKARVAMAADLDRDGKPELVLEFERPSGTDVALVRLDGGRLAWLKRSLFGVEKEKEK